MTAAPARPARDVLTLPLIGRMLKHRSGRVLLQIPFLLLAVLLIYDGFTGPQRAAENLATVVPWVHFRGVVVIALLLFGNLICMSCPFTLTRSLGRRFASPKRRFPRVLRSKWIAIATLIALFIAYEWLNLWASPWLTAWLIVGYFAASFILELLFAESAFCKYVCPLGSFNFAYSSGAPLMIEAKDPELCKVCVGKECVNGSFALTPLIRVDTIPVAGRPEGRQVQVTHDRAGVLGCGTELFVPQIRSNLDCTLCLDCARACPHDNVALAARRPFRQWFDPAAWPKRWDVILLIVVLASAGIVNAFGMIPPVYEVIGRLASAFGQVENGVVTPWGEAIALLLLFGVLAVVLPALLVKGAARLSRTLAPTKFTYTDRDVAAAFTPAFVPLGLAVWIAHYGFHFLIGLFTIVPAVQTFLLDHGITALGEPNWSLSGLTDTGVIGVVQVVVMIGGMALSLLVAERSAFRLYKRKAMPGLLPFALLLLAMMLLALLTFSQPMEMRGTVFFD